MTEIFAVAGNPILHSRSPEMHNAGFRAATVDAVYTRLLAESAAEALEMAREIGMRGLNVTAPFKEDMVRRVDRLDDEAKKIGAVNTVQISEREIRGFNTDSYGVQAALEENGVPLKGKRAVVIGAGGAAKAAVAGLRTGGAHVAITNRTEKKGRELATKLGCDYGRANDRTIFADADILVGTAHTDKRIIPQHFLRKEMTILDANYALRTALVEDAARAGCKIVDGREWLLYQGARAFEIFTGRSAPLPAMRKALYTAEQRRKTNLALIGFMGSGKTTVSKWLKEKTHRRLVDLDAHIERHEGISIAEIFEQNGERHFRNLEKKALRNTLRQQNRVIACGGGIILDPANRRLLRRHSIVGWLWATPRTIFRRIAHDRSRPLLRVKNREQVAHRIIRKRLPLYAETADIILNTEKRTARTIARVLAKEIEGTL